MILISHNPLRTSSIQNKDLEGLWGINTRKLDARRIFIDDFPLIVESEDILVCPVFKILGTTINSFSSLVCCSICKDNVT